MSGASAESGLHYLPVDSESYALLMLALTDLRGLLQENAATAHVGAEREYYEHEVDRVDELIDSLNRSD